MARVERTDAGELTRSRAGGRVEPTPHARRAPVSERTRAEEAFEHITRLAALVQSGLAYTENPFDIERYQEMQQLCAQLLAGDGPIEVPALHEAFAQQIGYATPKVDVRAGLFVNDEIVLVRERADGDKWTLPGGWADVGYSPAQCIVKEVQEECGLRARVRKIAALCDRRRAHQGLRSAFHIWKFLFVCDIEGGEFAANLETSAMGTFARDNIPTDLSLSRTSPVHIDMLFDHHDHPEKPTHID